MRRKLHFTAREWDELTWWEQEMYIDGLNQEAEAESGEEGGEPPPSVNTPKQASERFAETGETSLSQEPVEQDYSGMDALMSGARRRTARPSQ